MHQQLLQNQRPEDVRFVKRKSNMSKIIMLKGLIGSGKSTWAKEYLKKHAEAIRVNKDDIREMLFGPDGWTKNREKLVIEIRNKMIIAGLKQDKTVIVDDTNFHPDHEAAIMGIFKDFCVVNDIPMCNDNFQIKTFNVPLEICIERDSKREKPVGEKVIRDMYDKYLRPKHEYRPVNPKINNPSQKMAVICDLDGTLAHHNGRSPYDYEKVFTDSVNESVRAVLNRLDKSGIQLIFLSGREEKSRESTTKWLREKAGFEYFHLHMRATKDFRKDSVVKEEIYQTMIAPFHNILAVFDDRDSCVALWRSLELPTFQVNYGDF